MKPVVVIGILGTTLDTVGRGRWSRWRPTVDLCRHPDLIVSRLELLTQPQFHELTNTVVADIAQVSPETTVRTHFLEYDDAWDFEQVYAALHDFALAYPFDVEREEYLLHITTGSHVAQICEFLLAESHHFPARLLQTGPPNRDSDVGTYTIIDLDLSRYDRLASRFAQEHEAGHTFLKSGIATQNPAFNRLIELIERVAIHSRSPLLLMGPTGAGKSQLASRIYELKKLRRQVGGAFVEVNCATLRGDGAMSALFGHRKGAFTGAMSARRGLLKEADKGVLFLDEIGELGLDEQAMLLRAVEDGHFLPVGSDSEERSHFQLITGTNRDLRQAVANGEFREDLLARINLWSFTLPGLKDRPEDLSPNLDYELDRWRSLQGSRVTINKEARQRFLDFARSPSAAWSGNFRDFGAAIERMATLAAGGRIAIADVQAEVARLQFSWERPRAGAMNDRSAQLQALLGKDVFVALDRFDAVQLADVVEVCSNSVNMSEAGRSLFSESRKQKRSNNDADRVRKYLARFGLTWEDVKGGPRKQP
jgi:transcriptional regulatory protein RtcR